MNVAVYIAEYGQCLSIWDLSLWKMSKNCWNMIVFHIGVFDLCCAHAQVLCPPPLLSCCMPSPFSVPQSIWSCIALHSHHPNFFTLLLCKLIVGNLITLLPPMSPLLSLPIPSPCSPPCTPIHTPCPISHSISCLFMPPVSLSPCPSGYTQPWPKPYTMRTAVHTIQNICLIAHTSSKLYCRCYWLCKFFE